MMELVEYAGGESVSGASRAVFLSYASEDGMAAARICEALPDHVPNRHAIMLATMCGHSMISQASPRR